MRGGRPRGPAAPRRPVVTWQLVIGVMLGVAVLRVYLMSSQLQSQHNLMFRGGRSSASDAPAVGGQPAPLSKRQAKIQAKLKALKEEDARMERERVRTKKKTIFDGLEEDFIPKTGKRSGSNPLLSIEEMDSSNEEDGLWKGQSMDTEEDTEEDIHIGHKDKMETGFGDDPDEPTPSAHRGKKHKPIRRGGGGGEGGGGGGGVDGDSTRGQGAISDAMAMAMAGGGRVGRGREDVRGENRRTRIVKPDPALFVDPQEAKELAAQAAKDRARGTWDRYMSENVRRAMIQGARDERAEENGRRVAPPPAEEAEEGEERDSKIGGTEGFLANLDLAVKTVGRKGRNKATPREEDEGGIGGGGSAPGRAAAKPSVMVAIDEEEEEAVAMAEREERKAQFQAISGGVAESVEDMAMDEEEPDVEGGTEVDAADVGKEARVKAAGRDWRKKMKRGEENAVYYRNREGALVRKERDDPRHNNAAWKCKHLEECDEFTAKLNKVKAMEHEQEEILRRRVERKEKSGRAWGLTIANAKPMDLACRPFSAPGRRKVPEPVPRREAGEEGEAGGGEEGEEEDAGGGAVTGGSTKKAKIAAVRDCTRAVLRDIGLLHPDEIEERLVRAIITAKYGQELSGYMRGVVHDEVGRLSDPDVAAAAREGFLLAHTISAVKVASLKQKKDELILAGLEARARGKNSELSDLEIEMGESKRSWRSKNANVERFDRLLWKQMDSSRTRVVVAGTQYDRLHPGVRAKTTIARSGAEGASEELEALLEEQDVAPPVPLVTHKRQFLINPADDLPDDGESTAEEMRQSLSVKREGSVGEATHHYKFPPEFIDLLPREDRSWRYQSCAVVGNSGALLRGERKGMEIDSADAVIRINYPPIKTFERMVGTKTTFEMVNMQHTKMLVEGRVSPVRLINSTLLVSEVTSTFARRHVYPDLLRQFSGANLEESHVGILSPDFVGHAHHVWTVTKGQIESVRFTEFNDTKTYHRKPMTGFFAVMFALQVCEHVDLYGFTRYTGSARDQKYHYFDTEKASLDVHSFDLSYEVFRQLAVWPNSDAYLRLTIHR